MKNLSLSFEKSLLTRDEMRFINGGSKVRSLDFGGCSANHCTTMTDCDFVNTGCNCIEIHGSNRCVEA